MKKNNVFGLFAGILLFSAAFGIVGRVEGEVLREKIRPMRRKAVVMTVVEIDGHEYIVDSKTARVVVNTFGSDDPEDWEVIIK